MEIKDELERENPEGIEEEEEEVVGEEEATTAEEEPTPGVEGEGEEPESEEDEAGDQVPEQFQAPQEKMLTQSQVNELVGRARQEGRMSAIKELLERYGVSDEQEMNDVFGRGQAYDSLNDDYTNTNHLYNEVMAENALLKSQVDFNRWEDIKLILGGKGLEVNEENIQALLPSHPEWKGAGTEVAAPQGVDTAVQAQEAPSVMRKLGEDISPQIEEESNEEQIKKWYGIK